MSDRRWAALVPVALILMLADCGGNGPPPFNPTPAITNLFPSNITAGSADFTLFVVGTGFTPLKSGVPFVYWNGSPRSTTLNTTTGELEAHILASDVAAPNNGCPCPVNVIVVNPGPGGGPSQPPPQGMGFNINPLRAGAPTVAGFSPASVAAGGKAFTLTVNGSNFAANDVVTWNGQARVTTFVNSNQVTAAINPADITGVGAASVAVFTPDLVTGSLSLIFPISGPGSPVPKASSLTPSSVTAGSGDLEVAVNGSGFNSMTGAEWTVNMVSTPLATAFVGSSQVVVLVPAVDLASKASATITISNPAPGGGTSQPLPFSVD